MRGLLPMSKAERLLWFVSTIEDTRFLKAFYDSYEGAIDVVHLNLLTRISLIGFEANHYIPLNKYANKTVNPDVSKIFNLLSGRLNQDETLLAYQSVWGLLDSFKTRYNNSVFVIPSGRHVHHVAATDFAKSRKTKRLYINYSNFPGYTFFDPEGTDCLASIYKRPDLLDEMYPEPIDARRVFSKFYELKKNQSTIPQASSGGLNQILKKLAFSLDTIMQKLIGYVGDRRLTLSAVFAKKNTGDFFEYDEVDLSNRFMFFPMQVSTDQQVLVNYKGGSIEKALEEALSLAQSKNLVLYVREHPAEANRDKVRKKLEEMRQSYTDIRVVSQSVSELIEHSVEIVTINSTVGLECRLAGKPVSFLGDSFYEKASDMQLAKYLDRYLVEVDYHKSIVSDNDINKILKLLR